MSYCLFEKSFPLKTKPGKPKKEINLLISKTFKTTCRHCEQAIAWGKVKGKEKSFPVEENASGEFIPHLCKTSILLWTV